MGYIRTKDGIYKLIITETQNGYHYQVYDLFGFKKELNDVYKDLINKYNYKFADTIEELCDFYVVWLKNRELPLFEKIKKGYRPYPSYFEIGECSFDKGYGAIFTDAGLIYVAKMNNEGELELL